MEKNIVNPELVKVRCPQCLKLYNVSTRSVQTKKPKFQCNQCNEYFSLSYPECLGLDEVVGYAESWEKSKSLEQASPEQIKENEEKIPCIKCGASNVVSSTECNSCGIIFKKYREQKEDPFALKAPQKLKEFWHMVIQHYEDEDLHEEFLRQCRKSGHLEFASSRYKKILDVQPQEVIAQKFKNKIVALVSMATDRPIKNEAKIRFKVPFASLAMLLSSIVLFMGYFLPEYRNLMGIGAAFLFITTAIRLIFK
ncbi:MAG: hypothetical protein H6625_07120 [Bdellovibrionaceae bacterium]|nr:hypothetical protein [Pseudobdellovibrionaceae bacterium]